MPGLRTAKRVVALLVVVASLAACGTSESDRNVALPVVEGVDQLALTVRTTCIAMRDGEVRCRGESNVAQAGVVSLALDQWRSVFPENGGPTVVSHGQGLHVCAGFAETVKCWGKNDARQVEDSASGVLKDPGQPKVLPSTVIELVTGVTSTCALLSNGSVWCWGSNGRGQIGPNGGAASAVPVEVPIGAEVMDLSSGRESVCAVTTGGRVICWGSDEMGMLGDGPALTGSSQVREVVGYRGARTIELGARHACSVASTFDVWCWGDNSSFQNGSGSFAGVLWVPTRATRNAQIEYRQVAVADQSTCALTGTSEVWCWGFQPATGMFNDDGVVEPTPTQVVIDGGISSLLAGRDYFCGTTANRGLWCWGANSRAQIPSGTLDPLIDPFFFPDLTATDAAMVVVTTTTVPPATTVPAGSVAPPDTTVPATTVPATSPPAPDQTASGPPTVVKRPVPTLKVGRTMRYVQVGAVVRLAAGKGSTLTLTVARSSRRICTVSGGRLRGLRAGACKVSVTLKNAKGKKTTRTTTITVVK